MLNQKFKIDSSYNSNSISHLLEWFQKTDKNICIVTYAYITNPTTVLNILLHVNLMVSDRRLDFVAKMARNLVLMVREKCYESGKKGCLKFLTQVEVVGYSFGAHIGSRTCAFLFNRLNERVKRLIGEQKIKVVTSN